jgi:DNA invertase Pin-like site-specific DNA recombinase
MKYCGFVVRVSDPRQGDEPGKSPDNQREQLDRFVDFYNATAKDKGEEQIEFFREYRLVGVSGEKSFDDDEFKKLHDDIENHLVQMVIATGLDRFGRNVIKFLKFFEFLQNNNVDLVVTQYNIDTTTPTGKLIITILMALAEMQRHQLSSKITETRKIMLDKGLRTGGSVPLGFDRHPTRKGLYVINEEEASIVRLIFKLFKNHRSYSHVSRLINEKGFRTKINKSRKGTSKGGDKFDNRSVEYVLSNWTYCGWLEHQISNKNKDQDALPEGKRYRLFPPANPEDHPVIIPYEEFVETQVLMKSLKRLGSSTDTKMYPYILPGIVVCDFCKKIMEPDKGKDNNYYSCKNADCPGRKIIHEQYPRMKRNTISATLLENAVKRLISDTILKDPGRISEITKSANEGIKKELSDKRNEMVTLTARKKSLEATRDGALMAMKANSEDEGIVKSLNKTVKDELIEISRVEGLIRELEREISRLQNQMISESAVPKVLGALASSLTIIPPHQQKALCEIFFSQIVVGLREIQASLYLPALQYYTKTNGPKGPRFDKSSVWHARRDSNPKPSGP